MNDYDSGRIADLLNAEMGYERTDVLEEADLVVVNTCSIREKAQEKTFSDLGRIREVKKTRPGMLIAVGGCVASQEGENVIRRAPCVDVVFGPQTLHRLPDMLRARVETGRPQVDVSFPEIEKFDHLPAPKAHGAAAFVSIMEGCSKYCSYCVVPYTRGEEISRPMVDVLMEVAQLADQGVREVTLLGQNVNAYRGKMPDGSIADFALLLDYVSEIDGIERIRYTTSHPREFSQRIIDAYGRLPKLVNHVHLPVQAGSDRVLAAMKRGRSSASALTKLSSSVCPAFTPCGSVTVSALFLPLRSTIRPLLRRILISGGRTLPSNCASVGRKRLPPSAQAIASSTLVLPCPLRPPITVRPFASGSSVTARTRFTFSISNRLIFTAIAKQLLFVVYCRWFFFLCASCAVAAAAGLYFFLPVDLGRVVRELTARIAAAHRAGVGFVGILAQERPHPALPAFRAALEAHSAPAVQHD